MLKIRSFFGLVYYSLLPFLFIVVDKFLNLFLSFFPFYICGLCIFSFLIKFPPPHHQKKWSRNIVGIDFSAEDDDQSTLEWNSLSENENGDGIALFLGFRFETVLFL